MQDKSDISRLERLDQLSALLKAEHSFTAKELAELLNVSVRTISRDIAILRERGNPVEADRGRGGGLRLHRNWGVGHISLNTFEAIDLLISLAVAEKMKSPIFLDRLDSLRNKIFASFSSSMKAKLQLMSTRIFVGFPASKEVLKSSGITDRAVSETVHRAFLEMKCLEIVYANEAGKVTRRTIEPHYLYLHHPLWYILAWDHLKSAARNFRMDRITEAAIINDREFALRDEKKFIGELEIYADPVEPSRLSL